ncbi:MAG: alpha/beta fold hydrolase [Planctomycetota bacterium]|nr:alpha/beta fold hydrolase [Planctomycetota bacterium]
MGNTSPRPSRHGFADEYPFESHRLDLGGVGYNYVDEGVGPVILMVHGNPTWSFAWRAYIRELSSDYRVIAVDHVGCGFSDKPTQYSYCLDQHATNLLELVDHLGLNQITLCGHDWGGAIGMTAATRRPAQFSRFILSNTAAFRSKKIPLRISVCRTPLLGALGVRGLNLFSRAAMRMAVADPSRLSPAARAGYLAPYDSWAHRIAIHRFVQDIPLRSSHPSYQTLLDTENGLAQFAGHPVLLTWGEQDWCFTTEFLGEFERRFPSARTLRFPDAGHLLFEEVPDQVLAGIRTFLTDFPLDG